MKSLSLTSVKYIKCSLSEVNARVHMIWEPFCKKCAQGPLTSYGRNLSVA